MYGGVLILVLLGVAIAAPVLWVGSWAIGSVGGGRRQPALAPVQPTVPRADRKPRPSPIDLRLVSRRKVITVYDAAGSELATCPGPDAAGGCSRPLANGTVPCAGCLLALPRPIRGSFEWQIPTGYQACLLGSYDVFRAPRAGLAQPV